MLDNDFSKANEEYIRSQVYYAINKSLELKGQNKKEEAKKILNEMKEWLDKNKAKINEKQYVLFLNDIEEALKGYEYDLDDDYDNVKYEANMNKLVMGNMKKNAYDFFAAVKADLHNIGLICPYCFKYYKYWRGDNLQSLAKKPCDSTNDKIGTLEILSKKIISSKNVGDELSLLKNCCSEMCSHFICDNCKSLNQDKPCLFCKNLISIDTLLCF